MMRHVSWRRIPLKSGVTGVNSLTGKPADGLRGHGGQANEQEVNRVNRDGCDGEVYRNFYEPVTGIPPRRLLQ